MMEELQEQLVPFLKEHAVAVGLGLVGVICMGYGLISLSQPQPSHTVDLQTQETAQDTAAVSKRTVSPVSKQITIDIEGAVEKPGVYTLPSTSRIQDALIAAGGLSEAADRQKVAQTVNLAAPLTDSAKLYIPAVGEQYTGPEGVSTTSGGSVAGASTKLININVASESDLDGLPGIGQVTAQKIIANRPYQSVQELLDKKVVGQSVFGKIKDQVSVY